MGAVIVFRLMIDNPTLEKTLLSVVITGFIASLTVGGKALGKNIAIRNCKFIVLKTGYVVYLATYIFRRNKR